LPTRSAHPQVIDPDTFQRAQQLLAAKGARTIVRRPRSTPRPYILRGLLFCGICHRRMQGNWNNDQPYYRCTYPSEYARTNRVRHPRTVYLRESEVIPALDTWLGTAFDPAHLPATIDALAAAQENELPPEIAGVREEIAGYDRQLTQYRAALDSGGDPAVVGRWITETQASKLAADARLRAIVGMSATPQRMSKQEIAAVVAAIRGLMDTLSGANAADKAEIYAGLGLHLTYNPGPRTVITRAEIGHICAKGSCPRGT
jgi:site-specific DNA recombinase